MKFSATATAALVAAALASTSLTSSSAVRAASVNNGLDDESLLGLQARVARRQQQPQQQPPTNQPAATANATAASYPTEPPSPEANGGSWSAGFQRARDAVRRMSLEEVANVTSGVQGRCVGNTGEVASQSLPQICLQDGPTGVRPVRRVSQFPAGVTTAATWDRDMIAERGRRLALEFRAKGVNMWLGPVTGGPLGRSPRGGRNWEGWAADEYASGEASYVTVRAAQEQGIMACSKHFIAYEQETFRNPYNQTETGYAVAEFRPNQQLPISSDVDDKATHETYLWSFAEAVRAGTASIMCSYNRVNGSIACGDTRSLNGLLKGELNFQGSVVSDWGGTHEQTDFLAMDVSMPGAGFSRSFGSFGGAGLVELVRNGTIPESRVRDAAVRMLTPYYQFGQADNWPQISFNSRDTSAPTNNVRQPDTADFIRRIGESSFTLLKNVATGDGRGLPLSSDLQSVLVAGKDAGDNVAGWTSCGDAGACPQQASIMGGGSGWAYPPYVVTPLAAVMQRARTDGFDVNVATADASSTSPPGNFSLAETQAAVSEASLVFLDAYASEGADRANLSADALGDELVRRVAARCNNTVVVLHAPGAVDVEAWADHPNVTAIAMAYLPGQEGGASLPPLLWGDISPSGKLPFVMARNASDYAPDTIAAAPVQDPRTNFTDGSLVDWKYLVAKGTQPRYAFGHGLSYTNFSYASLVVEKQFEADTTSLQTTAEKFDANIGPAGSSSVYDVVARAYIDVTNTGSRQASEVAQLYVRLPSYTGTPPLLLRGFDKLSLAPGETKRASFPLRRKDLSAWDVERQHWYLPPGETQLSAGSSSVDLRSNATLTW